MGMNKIPKRISGKYLNNQRGLNVPYSRYREDGIWYANPLGFPCAFHDKDGYLIVRDNAHWERLKAEPIGERHHVVQTKKTHFRRPGGISEVPGYQRVDSTEPEEPEPEEPEPEEPEPEEPEPEEPEPENLYTIDDIINEGCFLDRQRLERILGRLRTKKNLILQGPPGTGKTWLAKKLGYALIGKKSERRVRPFQFHPNLSYEDFVRGWRPGKNGTLSLEDGPFLEAVNDSEGDDSNIYVVVIEEINRGNPAQIFGEMLTLLEADKRTPDEALALCYARDDRERVYIPPNLHVIGTMNVADRSLALLDLALRRRFAFIDLEPVFGDIWRNWVSEECGLDPDFLRDVERRMTSLNQTIAQDNLLGPQFRVGHSVVTPPAGAAIDDPVSWFREVVETEIGPLLDEYWFDQPDQASAERGKLLQGLDT